MGCCFSCPNSDYSAARRHRQRAYRNVRTGLEYRQRAAARRERADYARYEDEYYNAPAYPPYATLRPVRSQTLRAHGRTRGDGDFYFTPERERERDLDSWYSLRGQPRNRLVESHELGGRYVPENGLGSYF